jgi:AcrR family transcriptional regulator
VTTRTRRTRAALEAAALDLMERQGYDGTTAAQIAAAAGVSEMTFFRHFPSKAALVVDDPYDPLIADAVATAPRTLPLVGRAAAGLRTAFDGLEGGVPAEELDRMRRRLRLAAATPSLRPAVQAGTAVSAAAVAAVLVEQGAAPADAEVAASAVLAGVTEALLSWAAQPDSAELSLGTVLRRACDVLAGER